MGYQKIAGAVANLIGNKIPKTSPQNNSETVTNENDKAIYNNNKLITIIV